MIYLKTYFNFYLGIISTLQKKVAENEYYKEINGTSFIL